DRRRVHRAAEALHELPREEARELDGRDAVLDRVGVGLVVVGLVVAQREDAELAGDARVGAAVLPSRHVDVRRLVASGGLGQRERGYVVADRLIRSEVGELQVLPRAVGEELPEAAVEVADVGPHHPRPGWMRWLAGRELGYRLARADPFELIVGRARDQ